MKLMNRVNVQVMSRLSFRQPEFLFEWMRFFENELPQLTPSVCNWTDPVNKPWDLSKPEIYIPDDRWGESDSIYWRRKKTPKASGYFDVDGSSIHSSERRNHGGVSFVVELAKLDVEAVVAYIKAASVRFEGELAQVHWVTAQEESVRLTECSFDMAGANGGSEFGDSSLRHWLPTLPWGVVFGEAYVRLFGMDKLLSAPAYKVEQLSDTAVYLQLSEKLTDLETDYEAVHAVRLQVQAHLGERAFFDERYAYPLLGPMGTMSAADFMKALQEFKYPTPGTNGFVVPEFRLLGG